MKKIYCISGLGADERLFKKTIVDGYEMVYVPWVPIEVSDTLPGYAAKMAATIPDNNPILLGVSFGGMIATEICALRPGARAIIISSAKCRDEISDFGLGAAFLNFRSVVPGVLFRVPSTLMLDILGAVTDEEKVLMREYIVKSDSSFIKRALAIILKWERKEPPANVIAHIHGDADRLIPIKKVKPTITIPRGLHIMVYSRAAEVNAHIAKVLSGRA